MSTWLVIVPVLGRRCLAARAAVLVTWANHHDGIARPRAQHGMLRFCISTRAARPLDIMPGACATVMLRFIVLGHRHPSRSTYISTARAGLSCRLTAQESWPCNDDAVTLPYINVIHKAC